MELRLAVAADIPAMHRVRLAVRENKLADPARVTLADYARMLERDGRGWVCEADGAIVAFAVADHVQRNVWALFVHPDHERCGLGRALHAALVDWLFEAGTAPVWLSTERGSRAERFYTAAGWLPTDVLANGEQRFEMTLERYRRQRAAEARERSA